METTTDKPVSEMTGSELIELYLEGLDDALPGGKGFGAEHLAAHKEMLRRLDSHTELMAALKALLGDANPPACEPGHVDYRDAVRQARRALARVGGEAGAA